MQRDGQEPDPGEPGATANRLRWLRGALWADCWRDPEGPDSSPLILVLDAFGGAYAVGLPTGQDSGPGTVRPPRGLGPCPGHGPDKEVETDD